MSLVGVLEESDRHDPYGDRGAESVLAATAMASPEGIEIHWLDEMAMEAGCPRAGLRYLITICNCRV